MMTFKLVMIRSADATDPESVSGQLVEVVGVLSANIDNSGRWVNYHTGDTEGWVRIPSEVDYIELQPDSDHPDEPKWVTYGGC